MDIVAQLVARQRALGLTNEAFARRLGISRVYWLQIKAGRRGMGTKFLRGVVREFPDMQWVALQFLNREEVA